MKKKIKSILKLSFVVSFLLIVTVNVSASEKEFEINHFKEGEEEIIQIFGLDNYRKKRTVSEELNILLEEYPINVELLNNSENVYLSVYTSSEKNWQIMPDDGLNNGSGGSGLYDSTQYKDSEGYLTKVLIVYDKGYVKSGEKLFEAQSYVNFHKKFYLRNTDALVIWSGYNSVIEYNYNHTGYFDYNLYYGDSMVDQHRITANKDFSYLNGVQYNFDLPSEGPTTYIDTGNWYCEGNYYFVETGTTSVNSAYVHDETVVWNSLSISWGPVGLSIVGGHTLYNGQGITIYV